MSLAKALSRRQFLTSVAALGGGVALAACAPKATPAPEPAERGEPAAEKPAAAQPEATPVELRYLSWWGAYNTIVLPDALKEYKDLMPHVTVTVEEVPQDGMPQKAQTTLVAGTAADILYHDNYFTQYYDQGLILELDDHYDAAGIDFDREFYEGMALCRWAGKLYGFPHMWETCLFLYNKTMVQEGWGQDLWEAFPDGNWDFTDMEEVAKATTKITSDGKIEQWGLWIYHRSYYYGLETLGWSQGDSIFDVQQMKFNFTTPTIQSCNHWLLNAVLNEKFLISAEDNSEMVKAAGVANVFETGTVALYQRMSTDIGRALETVGDAFDGASDKFDWDLFYLPNFGDHQAVTRAGGHPHCIANSTKVADEAFELCRFLGMEGQKYIAKSKVSVPVWRDPELQASFEEGKPPHDSVILGVLEDRGGYGDHLRFHNEFEVRTMFANQMDLLYNMPYEEADKQIDEVCAKLEEDMNELVDYGDELPFPDLEFPFKPTL